MPAVPWAAEGGEQSPQSWPNLFPLSSKPGHLVFSVHQQIQHWPLPPAPPHGLATKVRTSTHAASFGPSTIQGVNYFCYPHFTDEKTKTQRGEVSLPKNTEPGSGRASTHLWTTTPHFPLPPGPHTRSSLPSPDADNPCLCFANAHAPCRVSWLLTSKKFPLMPSPAPSHHSPKSLDRARCPSSIPSSTITTVPQYLSTALKGPIRNKSEMTVTRKARYSKGLNQGGKQVGRGRETIGRKESQKFWYV